MAVVARQLGNPKRLYPLISLPSASRGRRQCRSEVAPYSRRKRHRLDASSGLCRRPGKLIDLRDSAAHCERKESVILFGGLKDPMLTTSVSCRSSSQSALASLPDHAVALIGNTVSSRSGRQLDTPTSRLVGFPSQSLRNLCNHYMQGNVGLSKRITLVIASSTGEMPWAMISNRG